LFECIAGVLLCVCVGNLYISSVEAADADTYVCEARFADGTVLTASSTLDVIGELVCEIHNTVCMCMLNMTSHSQ